MNRLFSSILASAILLALPAAPAVAAGNHPFWAAGNRTKHVQLTMSGFKKPVSYWCSGTVVSDRHVITAAHCYRVGQDLEVTAPVYTQACTAPDHCVQYERADLYRDGDLAVVTFPAGSFAGITPAKFGIQTPTKPLGMHFTVCGRNQVEPDQRPYRKSMSCTSPKLQSYMFSMRQNHTWPGEMYASATYTHWGPAVTYQQLKRWKGDDWAVQVHAKNNYVLEVAPGDSGGGWFSDTTDGERLVAVTSSGGPTGWARIPNFFDGAGVLLEGKTLRWANKIVFGEENPSEPPAITYGAEIQGLEERTKEFEDQLRAAHPELFEPNPGAHTPQNPPSTINPPTEDRGAPVEEIPGNDQDPDGQDGSAPPPPPAQQGGPGQPNQPDPGGQPKQPNTGQPNPPAPPAPSDQPTAPAPPSGPKAPPVAEAPGAAFTQLGPDHQAQPFAQRFTTPVTEATVSRIAGENRIDTATKMFAAAPDKTVAVLSTGRSYADGLAGGALAGALKTGIMLTNAQGTEPLEPQVLDTFKANGTKTVYITGGPSVIGQGVEESLFAAGIEVKRLAGLNRFETADLVAETTTKLVNTPGPVFIASGSNFPDALVASSAAARLGGTVRLVDEAHPYVGQGYCIGGPACAHAPNATKIVGQDRYETAYQLAARLPFKGKVIAVSGKNFPDALAAGALSAVTGATMVLTDGDQVGVPTGTKEVTMVGGANVIKATATVKR